LQPTNAQPARVGRPINAAQEQNPRGRDSFAKETQILLETTMPSFYSFYYFLLSLTSSLNPLALPEFPHARPRGRTRGGAVSHGTGWLRRPPGTCADLSNGSITIPDPNGYAGWWWEAGRRTSAWCSGEQWVTVTPIFKDKNRMYKRLMCALGNSRTHKLTNYKVSSQCLLHNE
jgi:hypothetical protein